MVPVNAAVALSILFTGWMPGRLFQMATKRTGCQVPASWASSFRVAKVSKGVSVVAAASSGVLNAVMLFSLRTV
jgi:hypothetical protein